MFNLPPPPLAPLSALLTAFAARIAARHPAILRRLGPHAQARFLLDIHDLPLALCITPAPTRITVHRRGALPQTDAVIRGTLDAMLGMVHGRDDGDALFFAGALELAGATDAVLALRNALDDAELDLTEELAAHAGPAAALLRRLATRVSRKTGLQLRRTSLERSPL